MVESQLRARGIRDERVLAAMTKVPRHLFVPDDEKPRAYRDGPLGIGCDQTISQPYIVARMCEALNLKPESRILDVGTGSGYAAAVEACLSKHVTGVERIPELAERARHALAKAGCTNVEVVCTDGSLGYEANAPFDAIMVAAGAPRVPEELKRQLAVGGRLIIPIGATQTLQDLILIERVSETDYETTNLGSVVFVPLFGKDGWF
ncbi:MAG: protein-L-isoaspartate(D-aspartate) O-methyltransferase [Roseibium sp.]|nr:protein-L-isoaspartate(D-aspartate) O-methyltransferase [Roseibium sp.]MBO6929970.1 protein-L-isoaspartate(D-aspartate) O-methyltransferase [Roseibium sp.]